MAETDNRRNTRNQARNQAYQAYQTRNQINQAYQARNQENQAYHTRNQARNQAYHTRGQENQAYQARNQENQAYYTRNQENQAKRTPNWTADSMQVRTVWNGMPSTWRPNQTTPGTLRGQIIPPARGPYRPSGGQNHSDADLNPEDDNYNYKYYNYHDGPRREVKPRKPDPEKIEEWKQRRARILRILFLIVTSPLRFLKFLFRTGKARWHIFRQKRIAIKARRAAEFAANPSAEYPVWLKNILFFLLALCLGAALTAAAESVCAGSSGKMRTWALKYTDNFLLTAILYAVIACLIGALSNRLWIGGALISIFALAFALVDYFKQSIDGAPLVLSDFGLADRAGAVAGVAGSLWPPGIFWQAVFDALFCLFLIWYCNPLMKIQGKPRIARVIISCVLCLFFLSGPCAQIVGDMFQVDVITRLDPVSSHNTYGLTVSLWRDRVLRDKKPPEGYGAVFMRNILDRIDSLLTENENAPENPPYIANLSGAADSPGADTTGGYAVTDENTGENISESPRENINADAAKKPNVIIILSESFFDITRLPGVSYASDPAANFHALQSESISGRFYSHYLGYGTGYIEMAMQTGLSGPDLGAATNICFMDDEIYDRLDSLPEQFTKTGEYTAEMLHGYDNSLYNRTVTYPLLGYSKMLFEKDLLNLDIPYPGSQFAGYYLKDDYLFRALMRELTAVNETGQRGFFYVITMGNHQPYRADKWTSEIESSGRLLNASEKAVFDAGLEGIIKADQALAELINNLREYPEPTIVAFYGDHRPTLVMPDGENLYTHLGMIPGGDITAWTAEQLGEIYSTDYLIWANDPALLRGQAGTTRPSGVLALGADILNLTGQPVSRYWALLKQTARIELVSTDIYFVDGQGVPYRRASDAKLSKSEQELLYLRECVFYDAVYGSQTITQEMSLPPP